MDKYKRYYGVIGFVVAVALLAFGIYNLIAPKMAEISSLKSEVESKQSELSSLESKLDVVKKKIKRIKDSIITSQKKIYSPVESDLGSDTLFFTLYNDVIEMVHANSVKIKAIDYTYNPEKDAFVKFGKDVYFVCDVNMELVSNYVNLGKLVQDIYQYPYYIKINEIEVKPYQKDKKILITNLSLRLYAHTEPDEDAVVETQQENVSVEGATTPLPQQ